MSRYTVLLMCSMYTESVSVRSYYGVLSYEIWIDRAGLTNSYLTPCIRSRGIIEGYKCRDKECVLLY